MKNRYIIHIDMDAFFAAIEQRDNPAYRDKPVVVGADPRQGAGRGVVSTCSYEAREFGIHSAMPISIAYKKCPQAIFLPVDYKKYSDVSGKILGILESFSSEIEPVSIDEAFLDISRDYKLIGSARDMCVAIKDKIKKETGLTASIGLAPTKMAAKIASGLQKPDGLVEVKEGEVPGFLKPLDVELLWGVGKKTKAVLNDMGIFTIGDISERTELELVSLFGKNGQWLWEMSRGIDESEVVTEREAKSISNETTFEKDTRDPGKIEKELARLCEMVSDRLREEGLKGKTITLKIRLEGFQTYTRARTLADPTNFSDELIETIRELYGNFEIRDKKVRLLGVRVSNFCLKEETLFENKNEIKKENIHKAVDKIRKKFGDDSICRAVSK
ncbi:MAG: DNA polymerase IV [Candidatus Omnitrophota bacterium]|jgi:nucleotidyltransferase/DNA polymerase involved in DNA repair